MPYTTVNAIDQTGAAAASHGDSAAHLPEVPVASQMAIKMLGTNGGGFFNANAAYPFENPTPLSNLIQILSIFAIPSALTWYLGRIGEEPGGTGWAVWMAMFLVFVSLAVFLLVGRGQRQSQYQPDERRLFR